MFFFFNDTATTEIYTLSLHDALPISSPEGPAVSRAGGGPAPPTYHRPATTKGEPWRTGSSRQTGSSSAAKVRDRKSTRLNSSHANISYAVFCLKKKKNNVHYKSLLSL